MKKGLLVFLFVLLAGVCRAGDSAADLKTFYGLHAQLFHQLTDITSQTGYSQEAPSGQSGTANKKHPKSSGTKEATPVPPAPENFDFNGKSSWADMTAHVTNLHSNFIIKVESSSPVEKWILKDTDKKEIDSGSLNNAYTFVVDHPGEFKKGMSLTLMIYKDGLQYPSLIELQ